MQSCCPATAAKPSPPDLRGCLGKAARSQSSTVAVTCPQILRPVRRRSGTACDWVDFGAGLSSCRSVTVAKMTTGCCLPPSTCSSCHSETKSHGPVAWTSSRTGAARLATTQLLEADLEECTGIASKVQAFHLCLPICKHVDIASPFDSRSRRKTAAQLTFPITRVQCS